MLVFLNLTPNLTQSNGLISLKSTSQYPALAIEAPPWPACCARYDLHTPALGEYDITAQTQAKRRPRRPLEIERYSWFNNARIKLRGEGTLGKYNVELDQNEIQGNLQDPRGNVLPQRLGIGLKGSLIAFLGYVCLLWQTLC